jgi:hypothetical protein
MGFNYKDKLIREKVSEEVQAEVIAAWSQLEEKYGIKFFLKNDTPRPVNEWLDDLYLRFTPKEIQNLMIDIMNQGDILFSNLLKHKE